MRRYTKPLLNKSHLVFKILNALRIAKPFIITPKEMIAIESVHGFGLILRHIKVRYNIVNIPAHYRNYGYVSAYKRRTGRKYYIDVEALINHSGADYLQEYIQNQINNLRE
jgi:hypothetical protein